MPRIRLTILPEAADEVRRDWLAFGTQSLVWAYGPDEPEYTTDMVKDPNTLYEGR